MPRKISDELEGLTPAEYRRHERGLAVTIDTCSLRNELTSGEARPSLVDLSSGPFPLEPHLITNYDYKQNSQETAKRLVRARERYDANIKLGTYFQNKPYDLRDLACVYLRMAFAGATPEFKARLTKRIAMSADVPEECIGLKEELEQLASERYQANSGRIRFLDILRAAPLFVAVAMIGKEYDENPKPKEEIARNSETESGYSRFRGLCSAGVVLVASLFARKAYDGVLEPDSEPNPREKRETGLFNTPKDDRW